MTADLGERNTGYADVRIVTGQAKCFDGIGGGQVGLFVDRQITQDWVCTEGITAL